MTVITLLPRFWSVRLANVVIEQTNEMIEEASFIGVMADETTDVNNKTALGIHAFTTDTSGNGCE